MKSVYIYSNYIKYGILSVFFIIYLLTIKQQIEQMNKENNHNIIESVKAIMRNNIVSDPKSIGETFKFLKPSLGYCNEVIQENTEIHKGLPAFLEKLKQYNDLVNKINTDENNIEKEIMEGNSGQLYSSLLMYWHLVRLPFVKTVCETGFNAGHSALLWLSANPKTKVYSFDLGEHKYSKIMAKHLQEQFPGRVHMTWGNSTKMLTIFQNENPSVKCDLIIVDGGHSVPVATADVRLLRLMSREMNIVIIDDHPAVKAYWSVGPATAWETSKARGELHEFFRCMDESQIRGISIGMFL